MSYRPAQLEALAELEPEELRRLEALRRALEELEELNPYQLSGRTECSSPDSTTSAGAALLESVRDGVTEALEYDPELLEPHAEHTGTRSDAVHPIADAAPDVYTATRWAEFVDLGAYQEDPTELGADASDMEAAAGVALYMIAERLAGALFEEAATTYAERLEELEEEAEELELEAGEDDAP